MKNKDDDKYVPIDYSSGVPVIIDGQEAQLPTTFDPDFINRQLTKIKDNRSMVAKYFTALKTKFTLNQQVRVLGVMDGAAECTVLLELLHAVGLVEESPANEV